MEKNYFKENRLNIPFLLNITPIWN